MDFLLSYEGNLADENELDFYDAARAMGGFQRSLALTAHLVINGEIITQAPALKNARIVVATPRPGSWEVVAGIVGVVWALGNAKKDSPFGHMIYSVYDYVVTQSFGFPVDYNKSLQQSYASQLAAQDITPSKLDSLSEKIEGSLADMHRPIVASKTADHANIFAGNRPDPKIRLGKELNDESYDYIKQYEIEESLTQSDGVVSSYNRNTYSGRIYLFDESRPIGFELVDGAKTRRNIELITSSLRTGAIERGDNTLGAIRMNGYRIISSTGRVKGIRVHKVERLKL